MTADKSDVIFKPWAAGAKFTNPDGTLTMQAQHFVMLMAGNANGSPLVGVVTNLTVVGIEHGFRISATLPNELDLAYVELWMSADNILAHATRITWGLQSTYDQTGFSAADGTKYFWVRCVNLAKKEGAFVGPVSAVAGITAVPGSVTGLTATGIIGGFRIKGTLPLDPDLAYVEVWMGTTNVLGAATRITWGLASSYDQPGFVPSDGVRYFWVRCVSTSGQLGAFVGPVSATAGVAVEQNISAATAAVLSNAATAITMASTTLLQYTSGSAGIFFGAGGLFGKDSGGNVTFSIVGSTGAATFKGDLTGASGTFSGNLAVGGTADFNGSTTSGGLNWAGVFNSGLGVQGGLIAYTAGGIAISGTAPGAGVGINGTTANGLAGNFVASGAAGVGVTAKNTGGGVALDVQGKMTMNNTTAVANLNADLLDGNHASAFQAAGSYATTTSVAKALCYITAAAGKTATGQYAQLTSVDGTVTGWVALYS